MTPHSNADVSVPGGSGSGPASTSNNNGSNSASTSHIHAGSNNVASIGNPSTARKRGPSISPDGDSKDKRSRPEDSRISPSTSKSGPSSQDDRQWGEEASK